MARFKLLLGVHATGKNKEGSRKTFLPGDVFDTKTDKETAFCDKYKDKFERLPEPVAFRRTVGKSPTNPDENIEEVEVDIGKLDRMTEVELRQFSREYGIDTKGATNRTDLLKNIKSELEKM